MEKVSRVFLSVLLAAALLCGVTANSFAADADGSVLIQPRTAAYGPILFDLNTGGMTRDLMGAFPQYYLAGTTVTMQGTWLTGNSRLLFVVFEGRDTGENLYMYLSSWVSNTVTLPVTDTWTCFVASNAGRTAGDLWIYIT